MDVNNYWEERFVKAFVTKDKQDRYLAFLNSKKKRKEILDRLNHTPNLVFSNALQFQGNRLNSNLLKNTLENYGAENTCYVISADHDLDRKALDMDDALQIFADLDFGSVFIFPPHPIALYRGEAPLHAGFIFRQN